MLTKERGFEGKMKEVDYVEGDYNGRKNQFQNYHTLHFLPENLSLKSKTKRRIFKKSRISYPHYHYL
jgi:hypothetical protein